MKLYSLPLSPYSARVRGALYAKQLDIEINAPPEGWRQSEEFRQINPARRVPVLILDDGTALPESGVIVEYLEDAFPATPLRPKDAKDLAQVRLITNIADLYVMQAAMPIFFLLDVERIDEPAVAAGSKSSIAVSSISNCCCGPTPMRRATASASPMCG